MQVIHEEAIAERTRGERAPCLSQTEHTATWLEFRCRLHGILMVRTAYLGLWLLTLVLGGPGQLVCRVIDVEYAMRYKFGRLRR